MRLTTFTVEFEIGQETRAFLERLVEHRPIQVELGPDTRAMLESVLGRKPDSSSGMVSKLAGLYKDHKT